MVLSEQDYRLIAEIQGGLPLVSQPFAEIAQRVGHSENEVIERINAMQKHGVIKRMGVVVRHHELGYTANAMVVWDVPEMRLEELGDKMGKTDFVTLCYQRPRRLPDWPFNLFCMIHGQQREQVLNYIDRLVETHNLQSIPHKVLFSGRRFKQRGARYQ